MIYRGARRPPDLVSHVPGDGYGLAQAESLGLCCRSQVSNDVSQRVSQINIEEWDSRTRYYTSRTEARRLMLGGAPPVIPTTREKLNVRTRRRDMASHAVIRTPYYQVIPV